MQELQIWNPQLNVLQNAAVLRQNPGFFLGAGVLGSHPCTDHNLSSVCSQPDSNRFVRLCWLQECKISRSVGLASEVRVVLADPWAERPGAAERWFGEGGAHGDQDG